MQRPVLAFYNGEEHREPQRERISGPEGAGLKKGSACYFLARLLQGRVSAHILNVPHVLALLRASVVNFLALPQLPIQAGGQIGRGPGEQR